jgi:o-succinylbenzoate---CoA ligase
MQITDFNKLPIAKTEYEQQVIDFCQQWLAGQSHFSIKTSGSTGEPKEILLTRQQMQASALLTGKTFHLLPNDSALVCLNVGYIAGMMMLVRGMVLGLKLTVVEPSSNPLEFVEDVPFNFAAFVPLQLQTILKSEKYKAQLEKMKAVIVGGAAVNETLNQQTQALKVPVFSTYGMTETVSHIAIRQLNGVNSDSNFKVLEGVEINIDYRNCLNIKASATNNELIQTNDVVELIDKKTFKLMGRFDNIINSGGVKIQLEKVEKSLEQFIQNRFFAYGIDDEKLGQKLVLIVESEEWEAPKKVTILESLKPLLTKYEIPKMIYFVPVFKETPTGKIDKIQTLKVINAH